MSSVVTWILSRRYKEGVASVGRWYGGREGWSGRLYNSNGYEYGDLEKKTISR